MVFAAVRMDATFRRPSRRVLSCVALFALNFLFLSSQDSGHHSFVLHSRRDSLRARQGPPTSTSGAGSIDPTVNATISTGSSVGPTVSSSTEPFSSSAISIPISSSISVSQSSFESTTSSRSSTALPTSTTLSSASPTTNTTATTTTTPSVSATTNEAVLSTLLDTPATTLSITNNSSPTLAQTSSEPSSSQTNTFTVGATSSHAGFWQNKAAVAATFVIVFLVVAALGAVVVIFYLKRRSNRYQERLHDELFDKYTEPDLRSNSPGLSINNSPMDAFASRDTGSDDSAQFQLYGNGISETQRALYSSTPVQHPDYYNTQSTPARYLAPSQTLVSKDATPPSSFHQPNNRGSYQPSIDSFYGAGTSGRGV